MRAFVFPGQGSQAVGMGVALRGRTLCLGQRAMRSTCGLVAMTSASHAEGRQFDPGQVYVVASSLSMSDPDRCIELFMRV